MANLKVGMIGLDTSHCPAFVKLLNNADNEFHVPGAKVVKAFPGGSKLFSSSINRVAGFTKDLKELGIEICDSIEAAAEGMDAFLLESVDGRQHLEQFKILARYGKPVFIDKPFACSFDDAKAMVKLAKEKNVPVMTASAIRYGKGIDVLRDGSKIESCDAFGPMALLNDYRDYFWYGIHSAETLYSFMGAGCERVQAISTDKVDVIVGTWNDGRIGTLRGNRVGANAFGCMLTVEGATRFAFVSGEIPYYALLLKKIVPFFRTGVSDIPLEESLEIIAFLEAASRSRAQNGKVIEIMK
ncbi:MAG: Gfo/Idh/MocA family oxidoreductase [Victivallaceae bacterium]|nr:Gfo/Idh/MocA family oxidoreductase [Victivallaceae bacterium]